MVLLFGVASTCFARESIFASNLAPRRGLVCPATSELACSFVYWDRMVASCAIRTPSDAGLDDGTAKEPGPNLANFQDPPSLLTPHPSLLRPSSFLLSPAPSLPAVATAAAAAPTAELPSAADVHASLDGDGDGCVTEAELRAAAEARGIELTEEQVQAFMALEADGDCVGLEAFLNSVDESEEGVSIASYWP